MFVYVCMCVYIYTHTHVHINTYSDAFTYTQDGGGGQASSRFGYLDEIAKGNINYDLSALQMKDKSIDNMYCVCGNASNI